MRGKRRPPTSLLRRSARACGIALVSLTVACSRHQASVRVAPNGVPLAPNITCATPDCSTYNVQPYVRNRSKYGIGCLGNVPPGTVANSETPPQSYRVADIGKPGVPKLTEGQAALVGRVVRSVKSDTLRIAWVDDTAERSKFIIFDALDGPCGTGRPYDVLNGACNEEYEPGENPYHTFPAPDCFATKRPWLSSTSSTSGPSISSSVSAGRNVS